MAGGGGAALRFFLENMVDDLPSSHHTVRQAWPSPTRTNTCSRQWSGTRSWHRRPSLFYSTTHPRVLIYRAIWGMFPLQVIVDPIDAATPPISQAPLFFPLQVSPPRRKIESPAAGQRWFDGSTAGSRARVVRADGACPRDAVGSLSTLLRSSQATLPLLPTTRQCQSMTTKVRKV